MPDIMNREDYESYQQSVASFFEREGVDNLSPMSDEDGDWIEDEFSWRPCECCRCNLGGNRISCNGYNPTTQEVQGPYSVCGHCVYYNEYGRLDDETMSRVESDKEEKTMLSLDQVQVEYIIVELRTIQEFYLETFKADGSWVDVRLQVFDDGQWSIHSGDSSYDQDHRGHWGCGSLNHETDCDELAQELLDEAMDSYAQSRSE